MPNILRRAGPWIGLLAALTGAIAAWYVYGKWGADWARALIISAPQSVRIPSPLTGVPLASTPRLTELSQSGDAFGGANALFAAIAGALVLWAGAIQALALAEEKAARNKQLFEATFFQLLSLSRELVERIESSRLGIQSSYVRRGSDALDSFADQVATPIAEQANTVSLSVLVRRYKSTVYGTHASTLGPYLRLLFQTFKHVAESDLSEIDKTKYANIARGQLGEKFVLLLALNGLTSYGYDFIVLIERFGLLKHLHPIYARDFGGHLRQGFRETAFMGGAARARETIARSPLMTPERVDQLATSVEATAL